MFSVSRSRDDLGCCYNRVSQSFIQRNKPRESLPLWVGPTLPFRSSADQQIRGLWTVDLGEGGAGLIGVIMGLIKCCVDSRIRELTNRVSHRRPLTQRRR